VIGRVFLALLFAFAAFPDFAADGPVMVFGTPRGELNDTEDRILREEIMRRLSSKGIAVPDVYDTETVLQSGFQDIRSTSSADRTSLAAKFAAKILMYGEFQRGSGVLSYHLSVTDLEGKALGEREIALDQKLPVRSQWQVIAESVSAAVKSILSPSSVK
jgi:hypothetical protein